MRKIGILTYWGVANYGAWAQAYALNNILNNMHNDAEVLHICHLEKSHWDAYYCKNDKLLNNFTYNWDCIPHTSKMTTEELESTSYDVLITGADSIWEEIVLGDYSPDWHLLGNNMDNCKRMISYAPSSGRFDGSMDIPVQMKQGLKKYDAISVRDATTQRLVEKVIGKSPTLVVDPALLWDFASDDKVKKPVFSQYIAVYGLRWTDEFIEDVKKLAQRENLKIISIGYINDWCDISFRLIELRAFEWLGMIAGADYVATSMFHGLMLGLNLKKQVKFCQVNFVKNRSQTLLDDLGLNETIIDFFDTIDYSHVIPKLDALRKNSRNWLYENTI